MTATQQEICVLCN